MTHTRSRAIKLVEMIVIAIDHADQEDSGEEEAESIEILMTLR